MAPVVDEEVSDLSFSGLSCRVSVAVAVAGVLGVEEEEEEAGAGECTDSTCDDELVARNCEEAPSDSLSTSTSAVDELKLPSFFGLALALPPLPAAAAPVPPTAEPPRSERFEPPRVRMGVPVAEVEPDAPVAKPVFSFLPLLLLAAPAPALPPSPSPSVRLEPVPVDGVDRAGAAREDAPAPVDPAVPGGDASPVSPAADTPAAGATPARGRLVALLGREEEAGRSGRATTDPAGRSTLPFLLEARCNEAEAGRVRADVTRFGREGSCDEDSLPRVVAPEAAVAVADAVAVVVTTGAGARSHREPLPSPPSTNVLAGAWGAATTAAPPAAGGGG